MHFLTRSANYERLRTSCVSYSIRSWLGNSMHLTGAERQESKARKSHVRFSHQKVNMKPGLTTEDKNDFMQMFPSVVTDLRNYATKYDEMHAPDWFERAIKYNVGHGKNNRGLITVLTFKELAKEDQLTQDNLQKALRFGWCVELLVGSLLALDDIVDGSLTRRKQPCWYKVEGVGSQAINDCLMIENGVYSIMDQYFSNTDYYMKVMEMFRELTFVTCIGQVLDVQASKVNISTYTMDQYKSLTRAKSSYGTFSLPVFIAMHMCGISDPYRLAQIENILFEICYYFQAQNDFEDCYGDPKHTGRVGTDIEDNRCTWLAATAIERASEDQKRVLQECYGQKDAKKVAQVRNVYKELDIVALFGAYEEETRNYIKNIATANNNDVYSSLLFKIWKMFYRKVALPTTY